MPMETATRKQAKRSTAMCTYQCAAAGAMLSTAAFSPSRIAAVDPDTTPPAFYTAFGVSSASPALSLIAKGGGVGYQSVMPFLVSTCSQRSVALAHWVIQET